MNQLQRYSSAVTNEVQEIYSQSKWFGSYSDNDDFKALLEAQAFLHLELAGVKQQHARLDVELEQVDAATRDVQRKNVTAATLPAKRGASTKPTTAVPPAAKRSKKTNAATVAVAKK
jgi:hypothetical protein